MKLLLLASRGTLRDGVIWIARPVSILLALVFCVCLSVQPASARVRALLVGVSEYENRAITQLQGPRNDVTLMWRRLRELNVAAEDITVLSDGILKGPQFPQVAGEPTLARIQSELARLAVTSSAGDIVIFFFAGHGTFQVRGARPGQSTIEVEEQILLPRDAGQHDMFLRIVPNGLVDHELGEQLDRIRAKGAFVWAIIDSCHAGYSTRDLSNAVVRTVDPKVLNIPRASTRGSRPTVPTLLKRLSERGRPGGFVGFYAVDSRALAIERPFPAGYEAPLSGSGETRTIGYFTYHLHRALGDGKAQTYSELSRQIVLAMEKGEAGGTGRLPVFDGPDLEQPLPQIGAPRSAKRWQADISGNELLVHAGSLHGFTEGSGVDLYADSSGASKLATATIERSEPLASTGRIDAGAGTLQQAALTRTRVWTELTNPAVQVAFRVAKPSPQDAGSSSDLLLSRAAALASRAGIKVELAAHGDVDVHAWTQIRQNELLLFSSRSHIGSAPVARHTLTSPDGAEALGDIFWNLARATHFARLGIQGFATGTLAQSTFSIEPRLIPRGAIKSLNAPCASPPADAKTLTSGPAVPVSHEDVLCVFVSNLGSNNVLVAALYVELNGKVSFAHKGRTDCWEMVGAGTGLSGRRLLGEGMKIITKADGRELPLGDEYLVVVALEHPAGPAPPSICHLEQQGVMSALNRGSRGAPNFDAAALMELLQPSYRTRSTPRSSKLGSLMRTYVLDVTR
jgi:hypothetical protein